MTELIPRHYPRADTVSRAAPVSHFGGQPVFIGAAALAIIVLGIGSIVAWRAYTGTSPELDRVASARQLQARTAQASEQLVEKTKGIEATQQESIDGLRQSFASAQTSDPAPVARKSARKYKAIRSAHRKKGKSQG